MTLTARDLDLLETLTCRVRMLTVRHMVTLWWSGNRRPRAARDRLHVLTRSRWIERYIINAHPQPPVLHPLFRWKPGAGEPDADRLSRQTQTRWSQPARPMAVYVASPMAAGLFGSTARGLPPLEHRNHDLWLASVYVRYRTMYPRLADLWVGEHALPKAGYRVKDPDAFLRDKDGRVLCVIESSGRYSEAQIESFHEHCAEYDLPYELW